MLCRDLSRLSGRADSRDESRHNMGVPTLDTTGGDAELR